MSDARARRGAFVAAFVAGGAAMAVEILSARRLAPAFGSTISTWSLLIAATLLAGAVGALVGGRAARTPSPRRTAAALLVGAAATALDAALGRALLSALRPLPLDVGAFLGSLALVGLPVVAFAAVLPLAIANASNLGQTQLSHLSPSSPSAPPAEVVNLGLTQIARMGTALAASTLGSLAGTLGAALGLLPWIGLDASTYAIAGVAAATAIAIGGRASRATSVGAILWMGAAIALVGRQGAPGAAIVLERESPYGVVTVEKRPAGAALLVDGVAQGTRSPFDASLEALLARGQHVAALPMLHPAATRALVIGLGSGLVTHALADRGLDVTTIEVNPVVVDVVRERWGIEGAVVVGDGRASLRGLGQSFDLAVIDAFQGEGLPPHLVTREAFEEVRGHLAPDAIVCVHLVGEPGSRVTAAVAATLGAVFRHTLALRSRAGAAVEDLFLLASDGRLALPPRPELERAAASVFTPASGPVLTDDWNPVDRWNEPLARRLRELGR